MTTMTETYTFGSSRNGYFNGHDGTITRESDGKTVSFNVYDRMLAVNVKDHAYGLDSNAPEDVKRMARELPQMPSMFGDTIDHDEYLYDQARESWWLALRDDVQEGEFTPDWATGIFSAGRSGGWCCIAGTEHCAAEGFPAGDPPRPWDEEMAETIEFREEFAAFAFQIVDSIEGQREYLYELVREAYAELEAKREANIIRGEN